MEENEYLDGVNINDLPDEILEFIIDKLSPYRDIKSSSLVCKRWFNITIGVTRKKGEAFKKAVNDGLLTWHVYPKDIGPSITERYSHCAVYHKKSVYIFGGCTATNTTFNDLWRFDLTTKQWIRPLAMGTYPAPKACSSLVVYRDTLVLFGGWSHPTPYPLHQAARYFNQLHVYCPSTNRWSSVPSTNVPPGKAGHAACVIDKHMFIFGGSQRDSLSCSDLWSLELEEMEWKRHEVAGKVPLPRYGHGMFVLDDRHLLVVGGCGGPNTQLTDLWVLDMSGEAWRWWEVTVEGTERIPPQLWCHPLCMVGDRLVAVSKALNPPAPSPGTGKDPGSGRPGTHSLLTTQLAQMRRTLPDTSTSESSSQDSSSDTDDVSTHGARMRTRTSGRSGLYYRQSAAECGKSGLKHQCKKCGNHWDVCVCTEDCVPTVGGATANPIANPDLAVPSTSRASSSQAVPASSVPFKVPIRGSRNMPSIKPNASKNRQKQLETLRKYEEKFRNQMGLAAEEVEVKVQGNSIEFVRNTSKRPTHPMYVHTLDISRVLSHGVAIWLPVNARTCLNAPDETIFYSLVEARGELVMFGGIQVDMNSMQRVQAASDTQVVSNNIYFLRPPTPET